jgi:hypothetical protein
MRKLKQKEIRLKKAESQVGGFVRSQKRGRAPGQSLT